jgi:GMP synthase-like glutamine amidotransferase
VRILVLQHDPDAPAGLLADWAVARDVALEVVRLDVGERVDLRELGRYQRLISLGSAHAADDGAVTWQAFERETLRAADAAGVPILGICFGGQSLAVALGGGVRRAARPEIGWVSIGVLDGADADPVAPLTDDGPWLEWHRDEILPPAGSEILAHNASGVQVWRIGAHVGLQFHPEVDPEIVGAWIAHNREDASVPSDLAEQTAALAQTARERAFALFDALLLG